MSEREGVGELSLAEELEELRGEVKRLRLRIARLEEERAALLRSAAERDYERPPHY